MDYGCGKGFDADFYGVDKYDPHFFPKKPRTKYDVVMCNYVLNVVPKKDIKTILASIKKLLKKDGAAYITVRRDIKKEGKTKIGTEQYNVNLNLKVIYKSSNFCIYTMK